MEICCWFTLWGPQTLKHWVLWSPLDLETLGHFAPIPFSAALPLNTQFMWSLTQNEWNRLPSSYGRNIKQFLRDFGFSTIGFLLDSVFCIHVPDQVVRYVIESMYTISGGRHTDLSSVHIELSDITERGWNMVAFDRATQCRLSKSDKMHHSIVFC